MAGDARQAEPATKPARPRPRFSVNDVARLGASIFRPMVGDERGVTARVERLRHALTLSATGSKRSLSECDDADLRRVHQRLLDIAEGKLVVELLDDGVSFEYVGVEHADGGTGVTILWSQLEPAAVAS